MAERRVSIEDLGALPIQLKDTRELTVMAPLPEPVRDSFVEVTRMATPISRTSST